MKFYNPFKPHIVEFTNQTFAIRKLEITGWKYYDNQKVKPDDYWWYGHLESTKKYYILGSLELAQMLLQMLPLSKTQSGTVVKKVHL